MEQMPNHNEKTPGHNLLSDPMGTVQAMGSIEGPGWMQEQEAVAEDGVIQHTLAHALRRVQELGPLDTAHGPRHIETIYGKGGINRWYVYSDGSVKFSQSHAAPGHTERARELGFELAS